MFCTKYKERIEELSTKVITLEDENKTLKAKVVKGQETVNKTNAHYKKIIAKMNSEIKGNIKNTKQTNR